MRLYNELDLTDFPPMSRSAVRIHLVGEPRADIGGHPLPPGATHVLAALLILALHPHRRVTRQRLGALLWQDAPAKRAERLRWLLSKLRGLDVPPPIDTTATDVTLSREVVVDAEQLIDALAANPDDVDLDDVDVPFRAYEPALGPDLDRWLDGERERLSAELLSKLVPTLVQARRRGDWPAAQRLAHAVRRVSPLHEEACIALAEALYATGDKTRAIEALDEFLRDADEGEARIRVPAELLRKRITADATRPATAERRAAFVGRDTQLRLFQSLFAEAQSGRGHALAFCGPPGIGKSRLLEATAAFAGTVGRAFVARARCQPGDALRPLSGFTDLVTLLLDAPGAAGCDPAKLRILRATGAMDAPGGQHTSASSPVHPSAFRRDELRAATVELLAAIADEQPLVVQLDDFQWADVSLRWLWPGLLAGTGELRVLWCFGARAEKPAEAEALWSSEARPRLTIQWLLGLASEEAAQLVHDLIGDSERRATPGELDTLRARGGGVPLVLEEVVRHWRAGGDAALVPATLNGVMEARLAGLTSNAQRALQLSSLLGSFSTLERIERVLQAPRGEFVSVVAQLEDAGILQTDTNGGAHGHALWGDVALRRTEPGVLRVLHRHVAETLDAELETSTSPALLWESARHWERAGNVDRALLAVERGAEHLARTGFQLEAAEAYERAVAATSDAARQRRYVRRRVELLRLAGAWAAVLKEIARWRALSPAVLPPHERHNDLEGIARQAQFNAAVLDEQAVRECVACASDPAASTGHRLEAAWDAIRFGQEKELPDVARAAYEILAALPVSTPAERRPHALGSVMYHRVYGDLRQAVAVAHEWHEWEKTRGDAYYTCWSGWTAGSLAAAVGDLARARQLYVDAIDVARAGRLWHLFVGAHDMNLALTVEFEGREAAREHLAWAWTEYEPILHLVPGARIAYALMSAWVALGDGDGEKAVRALPEQAIGSVSVVRRVALAIKLGAKILANAPATDTEVHALARDLHEYLVQPKFMLGESAGVYADYLDRYRSAREADDFTRTFVTTAWRELLPTQRLAPFVQRVGRPAPALALVRADAS